MTTTRYFQINVKGWIHTQFVKASSEEAAIGKTGAKQEDVTYVAEISQEEYEQEEGY